MSNNNPIDQNRRKSFRYLFAGLASVPLVNLVASAEALAGDLPHVAEDDPAAVGLQYKHDATQATRVDKGPAKADTQLCSNCVFIQADSGEWRPCQLFPGKAVNANGWCSAWAAKS